MLDADGFSAVRSRDTAGKTLHLFRRGGSFFPVSGIICMRFNLSKFVRSNALLCLMLKCVHVLVSAKLSVGKG
jgi:hypothetical protein